MHKKKNEEVKVDHVIRSDSVNLGSHYHKRVWTVRNMLLDPLAEWRLTPSLTHRRQLSVKRYWQLGKRVEEGRGGVSGVNVGSNSTRYNSFAWEGILRSCLCMQAFHHTDSKERDIHVLDRWMPATKTSSMHHPWRQNMATSMIGLNQTKSHIHINPTKNDDTQRSCWEWKRRTWMLRLTTWLGLIQTVWVATTARNECAMSGNILFVLAALRLTNSISGARKVATYEQILISGGKRGHGGGGWGWGCPWSKHRFSLLQLFHTRVQTEVLFVCACILLHKTQKI